MEQATNGAETAAIDRLVSSSSETFLFHSVYLPRIRIDSVMRPRSPSRGRNTSASVTVAVTVTAVMAAGLHCPWALLVVQQMSRARL